MSDPIQPMVSTGHYERVQSYIRKGIEAEVLVGGEGKPAGFEAGNYVKPTVFVGVANDMTIAQEEISGPVLSVITYGDDDEAVAIANDVEYGLHAYVYGEDQAGPCPGLLDRLVRCCAGFLDRSMAAGQWWGNPAGSLGAAESRR